MEALDQLHPDEQANVLAMIEGALLRHQVRQQPDPDFIGTDTFVYEICPYTTQENIRASVPVDGGCSSAAQRSASRDESTPFSASR